MQEKKERGRKKKGKLRQHNITYGMFCCSLSLVDTWLTTSKKHGVKHGAHQSATS